MKAKFFHADSFLKNNSVELLISIPVTQSLINERRNALGTRQRMKNICFYSSNSLSLDVKSSMYYAFREPNPRSEYYTKLAFLTMFFLSFPYTLIKKGCILHTFYNFLLIWNQKISNFSSRLDLLKEDRGEKKESKKWKKVTLITKLYIISQVL